MFRRSLQLVAFGALLAAAPVSQASAGSCCSGCTAPCVVAAPVVVAAPIVAVQPVPVPPVYVVNQGPRYSGPGIMTYPGYFNEWRAPVFYPYVSVDAYYPRYHSWYRPHHRHVRHGHRMVRPPLEPIDK